MPIRKIRSVATRYTVCAGEKEHEQESSTTQTVEPRSHPACSAFFTVAKFVDQVVHIAETESYCTHQVVCMEVTHHPLGVVHHLIDRNSGIEQSSHTSESPTPQPQCNQNGRNCPAHSRAINESHTPYNGYHKGRYCYAIRTDNTNNM